MVMLINLWMNKYKWEVQYLFKRIKLWLVRRRRKSENQVFSLESVPNALVQICLINSLKPRRSRRHFADGIFKRIFLKENVRNSIKISLNFVPQSPIDNIEYIYNKPLSEAMMVSLLTHICVARPQWVKPQVGRGIYLTHTPLVVPHASMNWVSIGSDNGLSPIRCKAII